MKKSDIMERLHQAESGEAAKLLREVLQANVRQALYELVEEEIIGLCGPKHHPKKGTPYSRAGTSPSEVYLNREKKKAKRPRVRRQTGENSRIEVHLKTWKAAQSPDAWEDAMISGDFMRGLNTGSEALA